MKKLKLKMDDLRVETFTTAGAAGERGTVEGHYGTTHTAAGDTCEYESCLGTCYSCDYTCDGWATYQDPNHMCVVC